MVKITLSLRTSEALNQFDRETFYLILLLSASGSIAFIVVFFEILSGARVRFADEIKIALHCQMFQFSLTRLPRLISSFPLEATENKYPIIIAYYNCQQLGRLRIEAAQHIASGRRFN